MEIVWLYFKHFKQVCVSGFEELTSSTIANTKNNLSLPAMLWSYDHFKTQIAHTVKCYIEQIQLKYLLRNL